MLNLLSVLPYQSQMHPAWLAMFLASVQCLPLAFRRVNPVLALICCGLPRNVYDALNFGYAPLPIAKAIAFATVADRSRPWLRWLTLVGTAGGISYAMTLPGHPLPYDAIVQSVIFGTAWVIGILNRKRRQYVATVARGPNGPRPSWTRSPRGPRRPPSPSGSASPASCTTWSRTTSA